MGHELTVEFVRGPGVKPKELGVCRRVDKSRANLDTVEGSESFTC